MVLIILADLVQVLFQLDLIQPAGFIHEVDERFATSFHLFPQHLLAGVRVPLKTDLAHGSLGAFIYVENDARGAAFLINWIDAKIYAYIGKSSRLINFDDFLARLFQLLFINSLIEFHFDFFAQPGRFDPFGAGDFDLVHDRPRLNCNDDLDAVAFGLSKNPNISNIASLVQRLDVLLHHFIRIRLANFRTHLSQNAFLAEGRRPGVLHIYGTDHRRPGSRLRRLGTGQYRRK